MTHIMIKRLLSGSGLAVGLVLMSANVQAGNLGTITYAPTAAVPGLQGVGLLLLAVLLGVVALRLMAKSSNRWSALAALGVSATVAGLGGVQILQDVSAITVPIQLNNPAGGTASVPTFYQEYINSSGVVLNIVSVTSPTCVGDSADLEAATRVALPHCFDLPTLQVNESCFTDACEN